MKKLLGWLAALSAVSACSCLSFTSSRSIALLPFCKEDSEDEDFAD